VTTDAFTSLPLRQELIANLDSLGFKSMTAIQKAALPAVLDGRDVLAKAQTGSGKTAAFGLGLLQALTLDKREVQALVLCPTRELADQVAEALRSFGRQMANLRILTLCGGVPIKGQLVSLEVAPHIVVGTPGRIVDHLDRGSLQLSGCTQWVLDEADRMLDMGFEEPIDRVKSELTSAVVQTLLFSATYPDNIQQLAKRVLIEPVSVSVDSGSSHQNIEQRLYKVASEEARLDLVDQLLRQQQPSSAIIFCNTKRDVDDVYQALHAQGYRVKPLHGDLDQSARDTTLAIFANGSANVLVATDVAARGLDIASVDMVINAYIAFEPEVHVHRIGRTGRTGRAGESGLACTLFDGKEQHRLDRLNEYLQEPLVERALPKQSKTSIPLPIFSTLELSLGKKDKLRPGDIVGALTANGAIQADDIGKISVKAQRSLVAVKTELLRQAQQLIEQDGIKKRRVKVRKIS
jgi:ATP-independent RNA helicase DbpA